MDSIIIRRPILALRNSLSSWGKKVITLSWGRRRQVTPGPVQRATAIYPCRVDYLDHGAGRFIRELLKFEGLCVPGIDPQNPNAEG